MSNNQDRKHFMANDGTVRSIEVGYKILDDLSRELTPIEVDMCPVRLHNVEQPPENIVSLFSVLEPLQEHIKGITNLSKFEYKYRNSDKHLFEYSSGIGDQDFTWHFAPYVAVQCAKQFVLDEVITKDQLETASLNDWATMIDSGWFSELLHDFAFADNGIYGGAGKSLYDYAHGWKYRIQLVNRLSSPQVMPDRIFNTEVSYQHVSELNETFMFPSATLASPWRQALRSTMHNSLRGSVGCPVARRNFSLDDDLASSKRMRSIIANHRVKKVDSNRKNRFEQKNTLIDTVLHMIAQYLEDYTAEYGQPTFNGDNVDHHYLAPNNVFLKTI